MIQDIQRRIARLDRMQEDIRERYGVTGKAGKKLEKLQRKEEEILNEMGPLTPEDRVYIARMPERPHVNELISALCTDFFRQRGDHLYDEDRSILGGIAFYHDIPVTVLGHRKGRNLKENLRYNFGMPRPEGYRKALRIMEQAEKFGRPIITFVDTPGAFPGLEAEEHGQGEAIARNLAAMSRFHVPIITVVVGEGNSGGALAISVANRILMLENAVYSILSPEGFASILWKDSSRKAEACEMMKLTAPDLVEAGVADVIVKEPPLGAQRDPDALFKALDEQLWSVLQELMKMSPEELRRDRFEKFRRIGVC
ncbi:MAG: acetyl-CoA carboxylase carboxyltransferase subunit alpha [Bilifractor sp.]|jgi:acetyl-CoA carboxylase carboxyl transferase subunit alpha